MSITYNPQGKITLEPTRGNVLGITEIVLQYYERTLVELEQAHPGMERTRLRAMARDWLEQHIELVSETIQAACRNAMMNRPEDALRRDLLGRILFHRLEHAFSDDPNPGDGFPRSFVHPVLLAVRAIIGESQYDNINEHTARPSLEYCIVHELGESKVNWDDFYSQNLVNILQVRIKNLMLRWLQNNGQVDVFIDIVNRYQEGSLTFNLQHFKLLMTAWGVFQDEESLADSAN